MSLALFGGTSLEEALVALVLIVLVIVLVNWALGLRGR